MNLEGIFVALITPFKDGKVNPEKVRELVRFQIENGTDGIVPCGTTGESPALTEQEKAGVIEAAVAESNGKVPVVAGTGTNNTEKTIMATKRAKDLGADAALVITPYYNKPTQDGLLRHFTAVLEAVDMPIVIYNVPGRTCVNILPATVEKLSHHENVIAIKEASGNLEQISEVVRLCGDKLKILSGDDAIFAPVLTVGGSGIISVIANVLPKMFKSLFIAFRENRMNEVRRLHLQLLPMCQALFLETSPIPIKTLMNEMGLDVGDLRSPLAAMTEGNKEKLLRIAREFDLL